MNWKIIFVKVNDKTQHIRNFHLLANDNILWSTSVTIYRWPTSTVRVFTNYT